MAMYTKEMATKARMADLSEFLLRTDPDHFRIEGQSVRMIDPNQPRENQKTAVVIPRGKNWAHDFSTGQSWNAVNFLKDKLGYNVVDAIRLLAGEDGNYKQATGKAYYQKPSLPPTFPERSDTERQMYAYLGKRGIPAETVNDLKRLGLIYQDKEHNNIVFVNKDKDFAEIRGTYSFGNPFHGTIKNQADRFWYFSVGRPTKAYVCEAAIDAVSLYLIKKQKGEHDGAIYVSIAGASNQQSIDRIKKYLPVILAVDNDRAGQDCRDRNPECDFILPTRKDWNEELLYGSLSIDDAFEEADKATEQETEVSKDVYCSEYDQR